MNDQKHIWTMPARVRFSDATWLVPVGGLTAGPFVADRQFSAPLSKNPQRLNRYGTLSNAGLGALIGAAGGLYFWEQITQDDDRIESVFLAVQAVLNSLVVVQTLKYAAERPRPFQDNGSGRFFHGGTSFPSEHAAAAFAIAGVISHEYPGPLTKLLSYGLASAVSFSRVRARDHFPSDVAVGGLIGDLIAQQVYSLHQNPEAGGGPSEYVGEKFRHLETSRNPGSPYAPLESWIYPALETLPPLPYIQFHPFLLPPWTRSE